VVSAAKIQARAPVFITPLSNVMARTGEKLRLECEVESVPESVFTWTKDGKAIKESQDILVTKIKNKSKANLIFNYCF
jgi:titin